MSGYFNNLSQQLFNKPLQECTVEEVEGLTRQYPYFAPAQFLLLKKLDKESKEYGEQFQRSILYYKNPLEFDYFIQNEHYITHFDSVQVDKEIIDAPVEEKGELVILEENLSANEENTTIEIPDENVITNGESAVFENVGIDESNDINNDVSKESVI
ncbi:MAG TPA: hypothetical protein VM888_03050, partial [Chitinophagaceae bacterium]|nr:hypothetical protein [Chitinophagaceae bacterium]